VRNTVARSPLMRKGGVHQRSKSSKRFRDKQALRREAGGYWNQRDGGDAPVFFCTANGNFALI
jgi:hypothetical protein